MLVPGADSNITEPGQAEYDRRMGERRQESRKARERVGPGGGCPVADPKIPTLKLHLVLLQERVSGSCIPL